MTEKGNALNKFSIAAQVALLILLMSVAAAQDSIVSTVPWSGAGQGPARTYCSPYAGPLGETQETMLLFVDDVSEYIVLGRDGLIQTATPDGLVHKSLAKPGSEAVASCVETFLDPTDLAVSHDGITVHRGIAGRQLQDRGH